MTATPALPTVHSVSELRSQIQTWRSEGLKIGFVPTMGALHAGHLALVHKAMDRADRVVVSIFVNPAQFAPGEDFEAYPRTLQSDSEKLAAIGTHLVFAPNANEMYPQGFATSVALKGPALGLETDARPHFFDGVATVVAKLLNQVRPDLAVFGEKDYQQLLVIRRLNADLDLGVDILAGQTEREADGLALSSRNAYLSPQDRERAGKLNVILKHFADALRAGSELELAQATALEAAAAVFDRVDYIAARHSETLEPLDAGPVQQSCRILGAVWVGQTRLIDNLAV